jgi:chorismate mutase
MNSTVDGDQQSSEAAADQQTSEAADQQTSEAAADQQPSEAAGTGAAGTGAAGTEATISSHRDEIDYLDAEILRLVKRRAEVSRQVGEARMASGGPRVVYNREMDVLARYRELGPEGRELAMILLRLGRGRLGR